MSPRRDARARHASGHVRRLPELGFGGPVSAKGAKVMVGFGLMVGAGSTTVATADASVQADRSAQLAATGQTAAMLASGRDAAAASRSVARSALPAVVAAQARTGPTQPSFGALGFTAQARTDRQKSSTPAAPDVVTADAPLLAEARALGLGPNAQLVYAAIRTSFPEIGTIGGYRAGDPGDHGTGHAVDIMCTSSQGDRIVIYLQAHAAELHVKYLIWEQRIWFPGTSTWRLMEDRGSITANHYDHVHVSVY